MEAQTDVELLERRAEIIEWLNAEDAPEGVAHVNVCADLRAIQAELTKRGLR